MRLFCTLSVATTLFLPLPAVADGFGFRTPSGNIYCNGALDGGAYLDCVIVNREAGSAPPAAGNCPAGRQLEVSLDQRGPARVSCGRPSGRLSGYSDIANYGVSANFDAIVCQSQTTGFSCVNADGRGFFLSRRSQQVF